MNTADLWSRSKRAAGEISRRCRKWFDAVSGAEGIRRVAQFHADVESLSAAIVTRLTALERSTGETKTDVTQQIAQLRFTTRLCACLAVTAIIVAAIAVMIAARRGA